MECPVEKKGLFVPAIEELIEALQSGLQKNFSSVSVTEKDCPNLTQLPWNLAAEGICGSPHLLDVGGVPYLIPSPRKEKVYSFVDLATLLPEGNNFFTGAGAGPFHKIGFNSEMMANLIVGEKENVKTHLASVNKKGESVLQQTQEKEFGLLGNFLSTQGKPGKVVQVSVRTRTGKEDFVQSMKNAINSKFPNNMIGMAGVFLVKSGKCKVHVMPCFSTEPLTTDNDVESWLNFYEVNAPFVCLSVFYNVDHGMDLRLDHTHGFNSHNGQGGHYHNDTTPDDIEYEGYFVVGETLVRVDRPKVTHQVGRD